MLIITWRNLLGRRAKCPLCHGNQSQCAVCLGKGWVELP